MTWPKLSFIWVNYNSTNILDLILESLEAISEINYPSNKYELIVVDNGSTDGSFKIIKNFLEKKRSLRKKIIRLERNIGFTGGSNIGFKNIDKNSKYISLLNNDAIPLSESITNLVEYSELSDDIGAVQGIILDLETKRIDTAGGMLNDLLIACQLYQGRPAFSIKKRFYISYADGAFLLLKVNAAKKATSFSEKLFYDEMFAYFDDNVLGLQLWNAGFKVISCPVVVALHKRSSSFGKASLLKIYLGSRGYFALNEICNSRFKNIIRSTIFLRIIRTSVSYFLASKISEKYRKILPACNEIFHALYKGYINGVRWGKMRIKEISTPIDIYKAPLLRISPLILQSLFTGIGMDFAKKAFTIFSTREFESRISDYIVE